MKFFCFTCESQGLSESLIYIYISSNDVNFTQVQGALRKDYSVAAQNLWDKDPGAWTGYLATEIFSFERLVLVSFSLDV